MRLSFLFNYFPHVEVIPANIDRAREVQDYNNISFFFFMYKATTILRHNTVICWVLVLLKALSQTLLFLMPSKLLILQAKSFCFTVSCVSESMSLYL